MLLLFSDDRKKDTSGHSHYIIPNGYVGFRRYGQDGYNNEFLNGESNFERDDKVEYKILDYKFDELYENHETFVDIKACTISINKGILYRGVIRYNRT
jgi:hypothetical protein